MLLTTACFHARRPDLRSLLCALPLLLAAPGCDGVDEDTAAFMPGETDTDDSTDDSTADESAGEPLSSAADGHARPLELVHGGGAVLAAPVFQVPFFYHQKWRAQTYTEHLPDQNSIDLLNVTTTSLGQVVVASAAGTVAEVGPVIDSETGDYFGDYVYIDHGGGWETRYLHIVKPAALVVGSTVVRGQRLGTVGQYLDMGVHLHYTQLKDGVPVRVTFNGVAIDVHKGAVKPDGTYPTQELISNNAPSGVVVTPTTKGAAVKCSAGAGVRAVVECESVNETLSVQHGPFVPAGETSSVNCPAGWMLVDRSYGVS